jgi:hypothetical protein
MVLNHKFNEHKFNECAELIKKNYERILTEEYDKYQKSINSASDEFGSILRQQEQRIIQYQDSIAEYKKKFEEEIIESCELKAQIEELKKSQQQKQIDINDYLSHTNRLEQENKRSNIQYQELLRQYDQLKVNQSESWLGRLAKYFFYLILLYLFVEFCLFFIFYYHWK